MLIVKNNDLSEKPGFSGFLLDLILQVTASAVFSKHYVTIDIVQYSNPK